MRDIGRIFEACTIAASSPAPTHSARNTELSTTRAAGFRPKEILDSPRMVRTSGWRRLISRMASMVAAPSPRDSSCPVPRVKVNASMRMADSLIPHCPVR